MSANYVYKINNKFIKENKYSGVRKIEDFKFLPYQAEGDDELVYAIPFKLDIDSTITKRLIKQFEKYYTDATETEREQDFKDYNFVEVISEEGERHFVLELSEDNKKEFTTAQLCFSVNGFAKNTLFINSPTQFAYYSTETLDECVGDIIKELLEKGVIYKARNRLNAKKGN